ncbi:MAG: nucleotidyltransferase family protein [Flavobacteriales bacterium]
MNIENIIIHKDKKILDALNKLNRVYDVSRLILFVIDDDGKALGSLTDGDIRRALVRNKDVDEKLENVCNRNFVYVEQSSEFLNLKTYRDQNLKILPILEGGKIIRIIDLEKIRSLLPIECMIMAGGRGKRLSPLTDRVPKPMLPLGNKPIIEHNIDRLIAFGVQKIYISVKYLGEQIQEYFGDGSSKGITIEYIEEDKPLGTAGALSLVESFKSEHVLLMNSDLFTNIDFEDLYLSLIKEKADMIVASTEYKIDVPYAIFDTEKNQVIDFREKPTFIYQSNAGIYILNKKLIKEIPKNEFYDITSLMEKIVKRGDKLIYNPILGYWIDIGKPIDYKQAQELIKHF